MSTLEYSEKLMRRVKFLPHDVHYCKGCPYFTKSAFLMVNHCRRHRSLRLPFNCVKNMEIYLCIDCNFQTELTICMRNHIIKYHTPRNREIRSDVKTYVCKKCGFQTYFQLYYFRHNKTCTGNTENDQTAATLLKKLKTHLRRVVVTNTEKNVYKECLESSEAAKSLSLSLAPWLINSLRKARAKSVDAILKENSHLYEEYDTEKLVNSIDIEKLKFRFKQNISKKID
ncbi:hypothetical protein Zmor_017078 [Zophobas morio]|uniref:C2H2-type domain-containing protein n=1 Tax=Zophobas morio TaxID=2755281 RepID=A0AA38I4P7_9CUCU|nr:hypothetical protein Zmor_017078 [Zophobas morio]